VQTKQEQFPHESLRLNVGSHALIHFPKNQGLALKVNCIAMRGPTLYSGRGGFQDSSLSTLLATTTSFNASSGCKNT
jgi:hypothetical protein